MVVGSSLKSWWRDDKVNYKRRQGGNDFAGGGRRRGKIREIMGQQGGMRGEGLVSIID